MPKVSVIIPTYNRSKYIGRAINSVLEQTYKDFEIIVVDDGSTDNTKVIISQYNGKIRYFYQNNMGVSSARNFGIREARGEYIAFLDADDLWVHYHLETAMNIFRKDKEIGLIYGKLQVSNKDKIIGVKPSNPALAPEHFWLGASMTTSTVVARRECFDRAGLFDESIQITEDMDMWIRILTLGFKVYHIPEILGTYRLDNLESLTKNPIKVSQNLINFHKKYISDINIRASVPLSLIQQQLAKEYYLLGKEYFVQKKYKDAVANIYTAIITNPLLGNVFIKDNENLISKCFKIIKPYLALCYCFYKSRFIKNITINILYFEPSSGFGGSASALATIINNINKQSIRPIVIIKNRGPQIDKINDSEIIKFKIFDEPNQLSYLRFFFYFLIHIIPETIKIYTIIKLKKISLVHVNTNIISGIPAIIAAKIAFVPCVCHIRQTRNLIRREKLFAKWVNGFIVLNKCAYKKLSNDIPENKLNLIYDGLDLEKFSNNFEEGKFRKELNFDSSPIIGLIGRIVRGKGHKEFILAAKEVLKLKSDTKFVIVGDAKGGDNGYYYHEIKELAKNEGLAGSIIFTGWRTDLEKVITDLDLVAQPYTSPEGLPNTLIEAMALRRPVIATEIPGPSEIVVNGQTGFLIPPGDIKAMAERIIFLLDNPEIAKRMGEAGRKRVEELFDIKKNVKKIEKLYQEVLEKHV